MRKLLFDSARELAPATVTTEKREHIARLRILSFDEKTGDFHAMSGTEADNDAFRALFSSADHCLFNVNMSQASLFFTARPRGEDAIGFRFALPEKMFSAQRRKHMRLLIPIGYVLKIDASDPAAPDGWASYKAQDVSEGGLSFLAGLDEAPRFAAGLALPLRFSIKSSQVIVSAIVRHARPVKTRDGKDALKVGVEFQDPPKAAVDLIARYIFDEQSRQAVR